jgi:hypothetical protein
MNVNSESDGTANQAFALVMRRLANANWAAHCESGDIVSLVWQKATPDLPGGRQKLLQLAGLLRELRQDVQFSGAELDMLLALNDQEQDTPSPEA